MDKTSATLLYLLLETSDEKVAMEIAEDLDDVMESYFDSTNVSTAFLGFLFFCANGRENIHKLFSAYTNVTETDITLLMDAVADAYSKRCM